MWKTFVGRITSQNLSHNNYKEFTLSLKRFNVCKMAPIYTNMLSDKPAVLDKIEEKMRSRNRERKVQNRLNLYRRLSADAQHKHTTMNRDEPRIITLANSTSTCSTHVINKIRKLEDLIIEDLGNRGISNLLVEDDLLKAALGLSHASSVALTTGFPLVNPGASNVENTSYYGETDGPMGTIAIATMLKALGKDVTLIFDGGLYPVMKAILKSLMEEGLLRDQFQVLQYPPPGTDDSEATARTFLLHDDGVTPKFDHILALERSGRAKNGRHYNMRGRDVSDIGGMEATDTLFQVAAEMPMITTTGIGDGGNELGMGKVRDRVVQDVPHGDLIACITASDYLITAGVSNWGGYAVAVALYLLKMCPVFDRYSRRGARFDSRESEIRSLHDALPNVDREEGFLKILMKYHVLDGCTGELCMSVDGMPFKDTHSRKIQSLLEVVESTTS